MIVDAHLHTSGRETAADVLQTLDDAGVDIAFLLAPFLTPPYSLDDRESLRAGNRYLSDLVKGHSDRLVGFAVVNPLHPQSADDLEEAAALPGICALKMVPTGWYPYDECAHRVYAVAAKLDFPILFHSGIFVDGRSGRFCRPSFYEAVRDHPGLRVTLAHLGWPWCDEANAVGVIDRINGVDPAASQFRFDLSFGPPPIYREEVFRKAIDVIGPRSLQFGSDRFLPCSGAHIRAAIEEVMAILDQLDVAIEDRNAIMSETAMDWLKPGLSQGGK
ncbi:amidohydrolase family protein [Mesorhizobium caraganae]|uniref:amidohydrolase family protein n=1 Tax=Mesorhizobium caraganae TaxID=483206 RepID=UPI00193A9A8F|nr:amidohydrolase family protein [Mesorhizobium caraganae]MBM2712734.1 amidohydrolase family protein [Mesorhizobium caraganae]